MPDRQDIVDAIQNHGRLAAEALLAAQIGDADIKIDAEAVPIRRKVPITLEALTAAAQVLGKEPEQFAAAEIERRGLTMAFARALQARGMPIAVEALTVEQGSFNPKDLQRFISRAESFRCRVFINGVFEGSGCLISPSLVLTAWHVVKEAGPIEVRLSDGNKRQAAAKLTYFSKCTDLELEGQVPDQDALFKGFNDVALIKLDRPDGIRLGYASLPDCEQEVHPKAPIFVLHFPQGASNFWASGQIKRYRHVTARLPHTARTDGGSSGAPCFNTALELVGLHQAKWAPGGRLVPARRFISDIQPFIAKDVAPAVLWSFDGTPKSRLVIGRDLFFEAVAAAARPVGRLRGLRIKRRDPSGDVTGLAFSADLLRLTLKRNIGAHRLVRINFEPPYGDLIGEIRRRAEWEDIRVAGADAHARAGETTLEGAVGARAKALTGALNAAAEEQRLLLWFFFDNPAAGLTDNARVALEAFIGAALKEPSLRVVLAGYETITTPGDEFATPGEADIDGAPGLLVEWIGLFQRSDIEKLLDRASKDLGLTLDEAVIADRARQTLRDVPSINGHYSTHDLDRLLNALAELLTDFQSMAEGRF